MHTKATQAARRFASSNTKGENSLLFGNKNIKNALTPNTAKIIDSPSLKSPRHEFRSKIANKVKPVPKEMRTTSLIGYFG